MSRICLVISRVIFCCFTMTGVHVGTGLDILARSFISTELRSVCCLCFLHSLLCFWCAYLHSNRNTHLDCCWHLSLFDSRTTPPPDKTTGKPHPPPHPHKTPYKTPRTLTTQNKPQIPNKAPRGQNLAKSKMTFILNSDGFRALLLMV